jgi:hypothetical protein
MEAAFEDVGAVVRCDDDAEEGERHEGLGFGGEIGGGGRFGE